MRNVPPDPDESVSEHVEHFFSVNHQDHYLTHQVWISNCSVVALPTINKRFLSCQTYAQSRLAIFAAIVGIVMVAIFRVLFVQNMGKFIYANLLYI